MESEAFRERLLEQHETVRRVALYLTGDPNDAADLTQDTLVRALRAADRFELRDHGMRPWLMKILHNCFYNRVSRRGPALVEDLGWAPSTSRAESDRAPDALEELDWDTVDGRMKRAIGALPIHYRAVLLLWAVEGLRYREIAERLGIPLGTVMSRLSRARDELAERLEGLGAEHGMSRTRTEARGTASAA
jgi:RNA polymerase sigma-70 factor (ECF subfamily)